MVNSINNTIICTILIIAFLGIYNLNFIDKNILTPIKNQNKKGNILNGVYENFFQKMYLL